MNLKNKWNAYINKREGQTARSFLKKALKIANTHSKKALDIGAGSGNETLLLLSNGWKTLALDSSPTSIRMISTRVKKQLPHKFSNLTTSLSSIELFIFPVEGLDLIYAGFSLPFVAPKNTINVWTRMANSLLPKGVLAVEVLGEMDEWSPNQSMTFFTKESLIEISTKLGLKIIKLSEKVYRDSDNKKWHVFQLLAQNAHTAPTKRTVKKLNSL